LKPDAAADRHREPAGASIPTIHEAPRTFGRMLSGRRLHLLDPSPLDLDIEDLLIGISRVNRWCGQTKGPVGFNVAHHSCLVEEILRTMVQPGVSWEIRRWALAHDLAEGVYGDVVTPVKAVLGAPYRELEARLESALAMVLGIGSRVPAEWRRLVKRADRIAAVTEAVLLAGWDEREARLLCGGGYRGKLWQGALDPWPEGEARERWKTRFRAVGGRV
jgi:5'-deoxynucleotidase YfbR-like HD superfamily hydrolase